MKVRVPVWIQLVHFQHEVERFACVVVVVVVDHRMRMMMMMIHLHCLTMMMMMKLQWRRVELLLLHHHGQHDQCVFEEALRGCAILRLITYKSLMLKCVCMIDATPDAGAQCIALLLH